MEIVRAPKPDIDEQDRSDGFSSVYCGPLDAALTHIYPRLVGPLVRALDATTSSVNELAFAEAMAKIDDVISRKIEQIPPQEWPRLIGISGARADELSRKILTMPGHESLAVTGLAFAKYLAIMHVASPSWHRITFVPASGALNADDQPGGLVMCHSDEPVAAGRQRLSRSHPKVFSAVSPLSPLDREDIGAALMNGLRPLQLTRLGYTASLKGESKGMHEAARSLLQSLAHAHGSRRSFYNQFLQSQLQRVLPAADPMTIQDIRDHLLSPLEVQGRLLYHADDMFSDASRGLWSPLIDVTAFFSKQAHDSGFIDLSIDSPASLSNVEVRRMSWVAFVELYDNAWRHAPRPSGRARLVWSVDGPTQGFVTIRTINDATPKSITEIGTWKPREGVSLSERLRGLDILDYICRLSGGSFRIRPVDSYKVECSITLACRMVSEVTEGARE